MWGKPQGLAPRERKEHLELPARDCDLSFYSVQSRTYFSVKSLPAYNTPLHLGEVPHIFYTIYIQLFEDETCL